MGGFTPAQLGTIELGGGATATAARIALHPEYVRRRSARDGRAEVNARADVAVIALTAPVAGVTPLPVASRRTARPGRRGRVLGQGVSRAPRAAAISGLRQVDLEVLADRRCSAFYRRHGGPDTRRAFVPADMLCAGDPDGRRPYRSACVGDSGGPLVVAGALAGVVSWGERCGAELDPTVFTDAARHRAFLTARDPVWAPVPGPGPATITGEPVVGRTLTCAAPPFATPVDRVDFGWTATRFGRAPRTARGVTYRPTARDVGWLLSCSASGVTAGGITATLPSAAVRVRAA